MTKVESGASDFLPRTRRGLHIRIVSNVRKTNISKSQEALELRLFIFAVCRCLVVPQRGYTTYTTMHAHSTKSNRKNYAANTTVATLDEFQEPCQDNGMSV